MSNFDGQSEGLTRDDILDNITLYWLTNTGVSSAHLYWENKLAFFGPKGVAIPTVVSVFPDEICPAPRSWAEKAYPKLIYYQRHPKGAHFAAWEQPEAIVDDLRAGFPVRCVESRSGRRRAGGHWGQMIPLRRSEIGHGANVRCWHIADIAAHGLDVRSQG